MFATILQIVGIAAGITGAFLIGVGPGIIACSVALILVGEAAGG